MEQQLIKSLETCGCPRICWLTAHEVKQQRVSEENKTKINRLTSAEYPIRLIKLSKVNSGLNKQPMV